MKSIVFGNILENVCFQVIDGFVGANNGLFNPILFMKLTPIRSINSNKQDLPLKEMTPTIAENTEHEHACDFHIHKPVLVIT